MNQEGGTPSAGKDGPFLANFPIEKKTLFGGNIDSVDIQAEHITSAKKVPVLFVPGMFAGPKAYENPILKLEQTGRRVLSLEQPRHSDNLKDSYNAYIEMVREGHTDNASSDIIGQRIATIESRWKRLVEEYTYPRETLRRALTLLGYLELKGVDHADIVGHSEGGIDAVVAAFLNPDKIRNLVLVETGGMIGEDTIRSIAGRSRKVDTRPRALPVYDETAPDRDQISAEREHDPAKGEQLRTEIAAFAENRASISRLEELRMVNYLASNPRRAYGEVDALARSPITRLLHILREEGHKVAMIHAAGEIDETGDEMFPLRRIPGAAIAANEFPPETVKHSHAHTDKFKRDAEGREIIDEATGKRILVQGGGSLDGFVSVKGVHNTLIGDPRIMGLADHLLTQFATLSSPQEQQAA